MRIGGKEFKDSGRTYIWGILNVTPDSFSDGGKYDSLDRALFQTERMLQEGMDVLDIGGESTRPGHEQISAEEEIERVVPVIEAVKARFDVPVSLDTYKHEVARAGWQAGADLINDIWGLKYDEGQMAAFLSESGLPCCLMHNRRQAEYTDFIPELLEDLRGSLAVAERAGVRKENIILDPGVGFAKTKEQNLEVLAKLECLRALGCPVLLGASRKSVIGLTLELPVQERLEGTIATSVLAVLSGCSHVRVHDVKENARAVRMAEAIEEYRKKSGRKECGYGSDQDSGT
ncbi:MAG TPA: dihydropteroate synthase [Candidatus Eisenbergiella merdavium]|uniref:Dihydropteroate synthase n=1 Tax=Candidatus Eisenbergiella merdavium TaxID=2838551 RepID=A0A9D2NDZ0_9FIRM|nr:dihydropteroate synthase [Candidatus Eisenbergiella merdavium]